MMKIEEVVGDLILLVLDNHEPLKKIGIDQDKIFVHVKGYDENGMWIHHPGFQVPNITGDESEETKKLEASILILSKTVPTSTSQSVLSPNGLFHVASASSQST